MTFLRVWFVSGVVLASLSTQAAPAFAQTPAIPPPGPESKISAWLNFGAQVGSGSFHPTDTRDLGGGPFEPKTTADATVRTD